MLTSFERPFSGPAMATLQSGSMAVSTTTPAGRGLPMGGVFAHVTNPSGASDQYVPATLWGGAIELEYQEMFVGGQQQLVPGLKAVSPLAMDVRPRSNATTIDNWIETQLANAQAGIMGADLGTLALVERADDGTELQRRTYSSVVPEHVSLISPSLVTPVQNIHPLEWRLVFRATSVQ